MGRKGGIDSLRSNVNAFDLNYIITYIGLAPGPTPFSFNRCHMLKYFHFSRSIPEILGSLLTYSYMAAF